MGFVFALAVNAHAQNSPYPRPEDNLGTWSWDKPQPRNNEERKEREPGETSWERMQAEQQLDPATTSQQETSKSLSPVDLLRWWRGEKTTDSTDSTDPTEAEEPESEQSVTEEE
jgi:hypothetical protein